MANNLTANPLVVDTASSGTPIWTGTPYGINRLRWVGATAGGTYTVKDGAGHVVAAGSCAVTNQVDDCEFHEPLWIKGGIYVATLTSGTLYIYLAPYR